MSNFNLTDEKGNIISQTAYGRFSFYPRKKKGAKKNSLTSAERNSRIVSMILKGFSIAKVSKNYSISGERARQIFMDNSSEEQKCEYHKLHFLKSNQMFVCENKDCEYKEFFVIKSRARSMKPNSLSLRFCSMKCRPIPKTRIRNSEEYRKYNRERMYKRYQRVKNTPHEKQKRKEYNRRASEKRKQKNAISQSISTKS